jgi:WD40 repeat protein/serine/threonine protein kinase/tetratricopeptide (TPR) repeat protein
MSTSGGARNPVELLAEEFLDRQRKGEQPTLQEYLQRHPDLADEIRDLFPALLMMEDLGESSGGTTSSLAADGAAVGTRLKRLGDYRILREIGRGGMGVVYEAEQESLGRRVALKVLSAGSLLDPKQVRRFEREAKAAARLHHTNIVPVFGVGRQEGHHYFVMQFIHGVGLDVVLADLRRLRQTKSKASRSAALATAASQVAGLTAADVARSLLTGRFDSKKPPGNGSLTEPCDDSAVGSGPADSSPAPAILPVSSELSASSDSDRQFYRSIARIGIQVAEALDYANRQGILHRDIKPSNLLLDNHGNVWVADFGLAKTSDADDLTHTGDILGTIRYMAPERFSGNCDARSDVYSLGLTLYELVALRPAYEASDRHRLMERVLHEEPERLKKLAPSVPRDLETIIVKAMARDPDVRYATAATLAEDLRRFVEDRPIQARRVSAAERLVRWCRRNPVIAGSMGLAALALVAVAVMALVHANRQARHAAEQADANRQIARLANNLEKESASLKTALSESNRRLAMLDLERGRSAFEKGHVGEGMLWTFESLQMATEARDAAGRHVALANLSAWRRHRVELKGYFYHGDMVYSVAFSPDGKTILTGCADNTARLWDATTGGPVGQPMEHSDVVLRVAFSPDGKTILTLSEDWKAWLWDAAGQPLERPMVPSGQIINIAFSPDGKTILTGCEDNMARLWDASTGRPIGQPLVHSSSVGSVAFSPDGKTILTGCADNTAQLWDAATGQRIGRPLEHENNVWSVAFSPDGKTILTGSFDKTARLWDAATGRPICRPMEHSGWVRSVAFSRDGKTILTGCDDNTAQMWDAATGEHMGRPLEHQGTVWSVSFSPDGRSILTGSRDRTARLWDGELGQPVGRLLDFGSQVSSVVFSPDGKALLAAGRDGKVRLWDIAGGRFFGMTVELGVQINAITLSPDGKTILTACTDKTARLWDAATGQRKGRALEHSDGLTSVAFSPDGTTILTGSRDKTARIWDVTTGQPIGQPIAHSDRVVSVAFSPDGRTILTGCHDRAARVWDAATGRLLSPPMAHLGSVDSVAFSPDGKTILTGSWDKTARLWDAATGQAIGQPLQHSGYVISVAFSPDGKTIVTGSGGDTVRLWDAATGRLIGPPIPHASTVQSWGPYVAFSLDGRFLLASDSRTTRLWDTPALLPDDVSRLAAWVEAATGLQLDERGTIRVLDRAAWLERRQRLEQLGGPPPPDPAPRLDPIIFGPDPAAQGNAWKKRGEWDRAEDAYGEAIHARPFNRSVRDALVRLHIERGHLDRAAATLADAVRQVSDDAGLRYQRGLGLLASGDRAGWRGATAALLDRFGGTINPRTANEVAWACVLGPAGDVDAEAPVRLAETAVRGVDEFLKADDASRTLGAALFRAGRFDEAICRLGEATKVGSEQASGWAFLAMAHHRLGHLDEARRWLDRLRDYQPSADPDQFWNELQIRLLRSEAEALILYDPIFPADPFAR